jgi:xylose isomerase
MLEQLREVRYSNWNGDFGQAMINGELSMAEISDQVLARQIDPEPSSGRQELLENVVNWYI